MYELFKYLNLYFFFLFNNSLTNYFLYIKLKNKMFTCILNEIYTV